MFERIVVDERLTLELIGEEHIAAGTAVVEASRSDLSRWMPWAAGSDEAAFRAYVGRVKAERAGSHSSAGAAYAICVDGAFAGSIDLHNEVAAKREAAIGYWLGSQYTGSGWATKSVVAMTKLGLEHFRLLRLEIIVDVDNIRSRRVAERAGFTLETIRPCTVDEERGFEAVYVKRSTERS
jgi:ribosomal-protein-serine acetyltransferase